MQFKSLDLSDLTRSNQSFTPILSSEEIDKLSEISKNNFSQFIHFDKYAQYLPENQRRETYEETITRNMDMHIKKFPQLEKEIRENYKFVYDKKVMPSMRGLQFAGESVFKNPSRQYNCSFLHIDSIDAFSEVLQNLLSGCFKAGTLIKTRDGNKPIEEVTIYDEILTYDTNKINFYWVKPIWAGPTPSENKVKLELELTNGEIIQCTEDHKFYTYNRDWIEAKDLTIKDIIASAHSVHGISIVRKNIVEDKTNYYDLSIPETHNYVLANGCVVHNCGVGYSVQKHHIEKLPPILGPKQLTEGKKSKRYLIADSIEGWSDSLKVLIECFFLGKTPVDFDFSDIRPKGARLVTSGGKAPGPEPLRECLKNVFQILSNAINTRGRGTYLKPIEAHDILCFVADAVLSGGIRRAAMISLFSFDDDSMINCKSNFAIKSWDYLYEEGPVDAFGESKKVIQIHTDTTGAKYYDLQVFYVDSSNEVKEKTIYWVSEENIEILHGIAFDSKFINGDGWKHKALKKKMNSLPWYYFEPQRGRANNSIVLMRDKIQREDFNYIWDLIENSMAGEPGFFFTNDSELGINPCAEISLKSMQYCNLTTINASKVTTQEEFNQASKAASFIGTLQAGYTDFHYLRSKWQETTEKDALLGVSITGIADNNFLTLDEKEASKIATEENERVASLIGINKASRVTAIKPEGCGVLETKLRTNKGIKTYKEIFDYFNFEEIKYEDYNKEFIPVLKSDLRIFDEFNNQQEIINLYVNGVSKIYIFETEDGTKHSFTSEHKFLTILGWKTIKELTTEDNIMTFINNRLTSLKVISVPKLSGKIMTVDIEVSGNHTYQLANGMVSHNTVSSLLNTSSGIHAWHDEYYIRRVRVNKNTPIYNYFYMNCPEILEDEFYNPQGTAVASFPIRAPKDAILRTESSLELLTRAKRYQLGWVKPGHRKGKNRNNVSLTVSVRPNEWEEVGNYIWDNKEDFTGISVLPYDGGTYIQAPFESITEEEYNKLIANIRPIDLSKVIEEENNTSLKENLACAGLNCTI